MDTRLWESRVVASRIKAPDFTSRPSPVHHAVQATPKLKFYCQDIQCCLLLRPGASVWSGLTGLSLYRIVQVYECMVRGIAVMRRRNDSYVNATQILKVAGIDKGRRTKILEKEILPGKHEIVQGGYGKYQGTWSVSP